ncbi:MAG: hypothetical protein AAB683_01480 [Patescibacteria group bacterium]
MDDADEPPSMPSKKAQDDIPPVGDAIPRGGVETVTNILGLVRTNPNHYASAHTTYIPVDRSSNVTVNVLNIAGNYNIGGTNMSQLQAPQWPKNSTPNRVERIEPSRDMRIGDDHKVIFKINPGEDVEIIYPLSFLTLSYCEADDNTYQIAMDGVVIPNSGAKKQSARKMRVRNFGKEVIMMGFKSIKTEEKEFDLRSPP